RLLVVLYAGGLDRLADQPHDQHAVGPLPHGEGEVATRDEDPSSLRDAALGPGQVEDDEVPDHGTEAAVLEVEPLRVGNGALELRMVSARRRHHALGQVDPERDRASRLGPLRYVARAGG